MSNATNRSPSRNAIAYRSLSRQRLGILAIAIGLLLAAVGLDLVTGPANLSWGDLLTAVFSPTNSDPAHRTIVWSFRLPSALMAIVVGASLGIAGAQMQTILNNPLASPFTLGVSASASFGAALVLVFGSAITWLPVAWLVPISAFAFALSSAMLIYSLGQMRGGATESIIVGGVALHFLFSAGVAFLQFIAADDALHAIVFWIFGTLEGATWQNTAIVASVLVIAMVWLLRDAWQLTSLRLGDHHARSLGIDVGRIRLRTLIVASIVTATAVCFTGAIGFVGLVAPHLARTVVGEDQRYFIPLSTLIGAIVVSLAAVVSKVLVPGTVFPIGIVTAALGAPFLAAIALRSRRTYW
ncbi:iron ABC transporter permease [Bremerella sp. JC817]|uniref:FecCD family ABC transporter permease n=1 Tax=Bremerella sp. JC817 TaxID=3231756 RepID=UPI00345A4DBB